jgi:hypothetical protein
MTALELAREFQHEHGCEFCTSNPCEVHAPSDWAAHDRYWRANNITSRRPARDTLERVNSERGVAARKAIAPLAREVIRLAAEVEAMGKVCEAARAWHSEQAFTLRTPLTDAVEALDALDAPAKETP